MRIACPACNATYQVPDAQLSEGRVVRCARCNSDWAPLEAIPATEAEPSREREVAPQVVEAPAPEPVVEPRRMAIDEEIPIPRPQVLPKPPPARRGSALLVIAWAFSLGVVGAAGAGLYVGRERVMKVWPPSIRAYAPLGLASPAAMSDAHGAEAHGSEAHGSEAHGSEGRE